MIELGIFSYIYVCSLGAFVSAVLVSKIIFSANMDRERKFAVLVVWTLMTSAVSLSGCSSQIPNAGFREVFASRAPYREEDNSLFVRDGQWSIRMRRELSDECDTSQYEESEMLELPATIGPTDRADVDTLRELYIRLNLRVSTLHFV